jgi:hypothetical protein
MYFRGDEEFYAEMNTALTKMRKEEIKVIGGTTTERKRAAMLFVQEHPRVKKAWDWTRETTRPARKFLKSRLGWDVTDAV